MTKRTPLKRHKALVALSRDHHFGLLLCWKLRQGFSKAIAGERMAAYQGYFFSEHLVPHFKIEEEIIFPTLSLENELRMEAERQHRELHLLTQQLQEKDTEPIAVLHAFEEQLEAHIRFEERSLFMHIQEVLPEGELQALQEKVEVRHSQQPDSWEDKFWE